MNKNVLIGLSALGGLILVGVLLPNGTPNETPPTAEETTSSLPSSVSAMFPIFPNTSLVNLNESTNEEGRTSYSFSLEANSSVREINEWYREAMSQSGWSIKSDRNVAGYQIIQAENNNLFTSMQATQGSDSNTAIISQQAQIRP